VLPPLAAAAAITIVFGSWRALAQDDLKRRLACSTVSQVSYIVLGTAIVGETATLGGLVHLVHQGVMKITLFLCAGNFARTLGVYEVSGLAGVGRRMPLTTAAFTIAALGMIGVPPLAGFVSKWYLALGAMEGGAGWAVWVLAASALLNAAYFLPILRDAWFVAPRGRWPHEHRLDERLETAPGLLFPALATAALVVLSGVLVSTDWSPLAWARLIVGREYAE
jgi:multicomponent Na+:H+ antiporter subunit D